MSEKLKYFDLWEGAALALTDYSFVIQSFLHSVNISVGTSNMYID